MGPDAPSSLYLVFPVPARDAAASESIATVLLMQDETWDETGGFCTHRNEQGYFSHQAHVIARSVQRADLLKLMGLAVDRPLIVMHAHNVIEGEEVWRTKNGQGILICGGASHSEAHALSMGRMPPLAPTASYGSSDPSSHTDMPPIGSHTRRVFHIVHLSSNMMVHSGR